MKLEIRIYGDDNDEHNALTAHLADSLTTFANTNREVDVALTDVKPRNSLCPGCGTPSVVAETSHQREDNRLMIVTQETCTACGFLVSLRHTYPDRRRSAVTLPTPTMKTP